MRHDAHPCRYMRRALPRHGIVLLDDAPPTELRPTLAVLSHASTVDEARDVLEFATPAERSRLVTWMAGRRHFRWEVMHAVVTSLESSALRRAVGVERAENLTRLYG